jgi:hypothetical protein
MESHSSTTEDKSYVGLGISIAVIVAGGFICILLWLFIGGVGADHPASPTAASTPAGVSGAPSTATTTPKK